MEEHRDAKRLSKERERERDGGAPRRDETKKTGALIVVNGQHMLV